MATWRASCSLAGLLLLSHRVGPWGTETGEESGLMHSPCLPGFSHSHFQLLTLSNLTADIQIFYCLTIQLQNFTSPDFFPITLNYGEKISSLPHFLSSQIVLGFGQVFWK